MGEMLSCGFIIVTLSKHTLGGAGMPGVGGGSIALKVAMSAPMAPPAVSRTSARENEHNTRRSGAHTLCRPTPGCETDLHRRRLLCGAVYDVAANIRQHNNPAVACNARHHSRACCASHPVNSAFFASIHCCARSMSEKKTRAMRQQPERIGAAPASRGARLFIVCCKGVGSCAGCAHRAAVSVRMAAAGTMRRRLSSAMRIERREWR